MSIVPASRPKQTQDITRKMISDHGVTDSLVLLGIRGYYKQTMGDPTKNDRGMYDDAIFVVSDTTYTSFNANVDPSAFRKGHGTGSAKGMADLKAGLYRAHQLGLHKGQYLALIQTGGKVTVTRDGDPPYDDTGYFGINIHRGGLYGTSSLGCQTIHPSQYTEWINLVSSEMKHHGIKTMPYLLVEV